MNPLINKIVDDMNAADFAFIDQGLQPIQDIQNDIVNFLAKVNELIGEYKTTGSVPSPEILENWGKASSEDTPKEIQTQQTTLKSTGKQSSIKENIEPKSSAKKEPSPPRTRPKRNAFKEASQNIAHQSSLSSTAKLRRPANLEDTFQNVYVKTEKLSTDSEDTTASTTTALDINIKSEEETMPAPSRPAPRRKKHKQSKVQVKQEKAEEEKRDSDVVIQDTAITTINLVDSADEGDQTIKNEQKPRSTRTKTVKKKMKRSRAHSSEDEDKREKRSRSNEENDEQTMVNGMQFDDAVSSVVENKNDATFVAKAASGTEEAAQEALSTTIVVENPKLVTSLMPKTVQDMMTDDESEEEEPKKPVKPIRAIPKPTKQVFSPFEQSPVKKKVQAFEKLQEDANSLPPRMTRTKTKAKAKENEVAAEPEHNPPSNVKEKAKIFTPQVSKFLPKVASTANKPSRQTPSSSNESLASTKTLSALKASQAEYREREKKRREKEQEAIKKREALLQAQIEEKKRKREEKQLKAQQQREVLEKEKMKILEAHKLKDERHRQLLAEQEEKKLKQREEAEKKRLMAKMRALEEKKREEEKRAQEQRKVETVEDKRPVYMRYRAPFLPTDDCYDSDDENYRPEKVKLPDFAKEANIRFILQCAFAAGEAVKNTFFSIQAQTPDLQDIFEVIKPEKLKRTSSAVWHKPPRFTMVPVLENHDETAEFEDD